MDNSSKGTMLERNRKKLSDANILRRLIKHFNGELPVPLDSGQVQLGIAFMRKLIPDLQSTTVSHSVDHSSLNIHELNARLSSLGYQPQNVWSQLNGEAPITIEHEPEQEIKDQSVLADPNK